MTVLSRIAHEWAVSAFGEAHVNNLPVRSLRTVEEAIELCQALGVPCDKVHQCVDMVYSRPIGDVKQEIGGVLLTIQILCEQLDLEANDVFADELSRVLKKPLKHFAERNQQKLDLGMSVDPVVIPGGMGNLGDGGVGGVDPAVVGLDPAAIRAARGLG